MKYSNYNIIRNIDGQLYIYNTISSKIIKVDKEILDNIDNLNDNTIEIFKKNGMIIEDTIDELKYLEDRYHDSQEKKDLLTITVAPTLRCNFKCSYCYENKNGKIVNEDSQEKIVEFIKKQLKLGYKDFNMIWFGGEPLLAYKEIKNMSKSIIKVCDEMGVNYNAYMTTNGYLLNDEIIEELPKLRINQLYITLDGTKDVHDSRRCLINDGETFDVITSNLMKLKEKNINTIIRMNVDNTNYDEIENLENYVTTYLDMPMYLGLVRKYTDSCDSNDIYYTKKEFSKIQIEFDDLQNKHNIDTNIVPRQLPIYCRACKVGTFVIDPDLNIFKCENDIGRAEKRISTIDDYPFKNELNDVLNKSYYEWNPFSFNKCRECKILPICMGGCPYVGIKYGDAECETYKYQIKDVMKKNIKHGS